MRTQGILTSIKPGIWVPTIQVPPDDHNILSLVPCTCRSIFATNRLPTVVWLMVFDLAVLAVDGEPPRFPVIAVPPETSIEVYFGELVLSTGLVWASTSTWGVLTNTAITPLVVSAELV